MTGADLIMPQQFLQADPLAAIIDRHRPTLSAGVPTIWSDLLRYAQTNPVDLSSLRMITAGGPRCPASSSSGSRTSSGSRWSRAGA